MRGENPISFPIRIYPTDNIMDVFPTKTSSGLDIPEAEILKKGDIALTPSIMSEHQAKAYTKLDKSGERGENNDTTIVQASNIIYPNGQTGNDGMMNCLEILSSEREDLKMTYKDGYENCLDFSNIAKYSAKFKTILESIKNSTGIVFIYSRFLPGGLIPFAIALEHMGFKKYGGKNILSNLNNKSKKPPVYSLITPTRSYTPNFDEEVDVAKSDANKDGDLIKVILGSTVSGEGIDFKNIREIHIIDPWWHLNKMEQVTGRAVRNCSHILLPAKKRNVSIFYHVGKIKDRENEMIDDKIYRTAFRKQFQMEKVDDVLKSNAVDCNLNKADLYFDKKKINYKMDIETSQNKKLTVFLGDDDTRYKNIQCADNNLPEDPIDKTTYTKNFFHTEIASATKEITKFYKRNSFAKYEQIVTALSNYEPKIIKYALQEMIVKKTAIRKGTGYIVYLSDRYLFQPNNNEKTMSLKAREDLSNIASIDFLKIPATIENAISKSSTETVDVDSHIQKMVEIYGDEFKNEIVDYVLDRLHFKQIIELVKDPIKRKLYQQSLFEGNIFVDENGALIRNVFAPVEEYWILENNSYKIASGYDIETYTETEEKAVVNLDKLKGYISFILKNGDLVVNFKMIDSSKKSSAGYVCAPSANKEVLVQLVNPDGKKKKLHDANKQILCIIYELMLRKERHSFARIHQGKMIKKTRSAAASTSL